MHISVQDRNRGELWERNGRWHWQRGTHAIETYSRDTTLDDVLAHVARIFRVEASQVRIIEGA